LAKFQTPNSKSIGERDSKLNFRASLELGIWNLFPPVKSFFGFLRCLLLHIFLSSRLCGRCEPCLSTSLRFSLVAHCWPHCCIGSFNLWRTRFPIFSRIFSQKSPSRPFTATSIAPSSASP